MTGWFMKILIPSKDKFLKFFFVSIFVTTIDYLIFFSLYRLTGILSAHIISYIIAIILSFILQKRFVFETNKSTTVTFLGILFFSLIGISLGYTFLFSYHWLFGNIIIAKILMTVTMFFYNFFSKKFAFEYMRYPQS